MSVKEFELLIQHDCWANHRVCGVISDLELIPEKSKKIFDHILGAQHIWISRMKNEMSSMAVWPNLEKPQWNELIDMHRDALLKLCESQESLDRVITYSNTQGQEYSNTVSELLLHLAMHSQYHRGQVISCARAQLKEVPSTDMIAYLRMA